MLPGASAPGGRNPRRSRARQGNVLLFTPTAVVAMTTFGATSTNDEAPRERREPESLLGALDTLAEKVEMARATIVKLREDNEELRERSDDLRGRLSRYEASGTPEQIAGSHEELERLVGERDALLEERERVAERVRGILGKVAALEGLS